MNSLFDRLARFELLLVVSSFALLIGLVAFLNADFDAELAACSAWRLHTVYGGLGCVVGFNGEAAHVEGVTNLRNLSFFGGGSESFSLGYEIATNRLLFPYLGSFILPFVGTLLDTYAVLNLVWWLIAAVSGYWLVRSLNGGAHAAVFAGVFIATGIGFAATWMGLKAHLLSYSYYIFSIYVLERLRFFDSEISNRQLLAAGAVVGLGVFANGLILPLLIYAAVLLLPRLQIRRLVLLAIVAALPILTIKAGFLLAGTSSGDRTDSVLLTHFIDHLRMIASWLTGGSPEPINILQIEVTSPWQPFMWGMQMLVNVPMFFGVSGLVIALIGLAPPWGRIQAVAVASILAISLSVFVVQTYWPFWSFMGYTVYYVYAGFALLMALGVCRLTKGIAYIAETMFSIEARILRAAIFSALTLIWVGIASHHVATDWHLAFFQYYNRYSIDFPIDWNFRLADW